MLAVQVPGDRLRALASRNSRKIRSTMAASVRLDASPTPLALSACHGPVAKGEPAGDAALQHAAELAALGLLAQILQRHLGHHAHHSDMDRRDLAQRRREQPDLVEGQPVLQVGRVRQTPPEPVHGLADYHVEAASLGLTQQVLERRPEAARPAQRRVGEGVHHQPALRDGISPATSSWSSIEAPF